MSWGENDIGCWWAISGEKVDISNCE
jgi:hypothetical protein